MLVEVKTVARCARRQPGRERGRAAFEVGARTVDGIRVDDDAGVSERHMFAAGSRKYGLVIDTGIGHADAELDERCDRAAFELQHPGALTDGVGLAETCRARLALG